MTVKPYQVLLTNAQGEREVVVYHANGPANAYYTAAELHPGYEVKVMGLLPEWGGDDPL